MPSTRSPSHRRQQRKRDAGIHADHDRPLADAIRQPAITIAPMPPPMLNIICTMLAWTGVEAAREHHRRQPVHQEIQHDQRAQVADPQGDGRPRVRR
jgi:hypothetical protein